jgi:hypothetical protein
MNVRRLDGALLSLWVAKSAGLQLSPVEPKANEQHDPDSGYWHPVTYSPATDWSQAGPIVSSEWYGIEDTLIEWFGSEWTQMKDITDNPLKWFMRAYVATQYGNEVEEITVVRPMQLSSDSSAAPVSRPAALHWSRR